MVYFSPDFGSVAINPVFPKNRISGQNRISFLEIRFFFSLEIRFFFSLEIRFFPKIGFQISSYGEIDNAVTTSDLTPQAGPLQILFKIISLNTYV